VHAEPDLDGVKISIGDTGCGIAPENLAEVLEPFFTTRPTATAWG
jgi:signal transduction histidine kinase